MKTILSIQSQVAGARVGNSVAAFAMERLGVRVFQLPTTILGRRPDHGAPGGGKVPAETLASLIDGMAADWLFGEIDAVLTGYLGDAEQAPVILDAVARHFGVTVEDLRSKARHKEIVAPRHLAMYLLREDARLSYPQIGQLLGGRDHSSVLHACDKIGLDVERNGRSIDDARSVRNLLR
mgnify:CR=1 FL=1